MNDAAIGARPPRFRPEVVRLGILCGTLYFIQGMCEPESGLLSQPVNSLLRLRGFTTEDAGTFALILGIPWMLKLGYGLLSDFVPLWGYRRRSWLLLMSAASAVSFTLLSVVPSLQATWNGLLIWMLIANLSVAFSDVVIDATMVEKGQPLGATGPLQSIQWGALNASSALAAFGGGWLSQNQMHHVAFEVCAGFSILAVVMVYFAVKEDRGAIPEQSLGSTVRALAMTIRSPVILAVGAYLFLWSFNPFNWVVLYRYQTEQLGFSEQACGNIDTVGYLCAAASGLLFAWYGSRIPFNLQVHLSVLLGILATIAYWALDGIVSAYLIGAGVAAILLAATVIQLDLAARVCPPQIAGTVFASLMAVSNAGVSASKWLGGKWYDAWSTSLGAPTAFNLLVGVGALFTAASWLLVPVLLRHQRSMTDAAAEP